MVFSAKCLGLAELKLGRSRDAARCPHIVGFLGEFDPTNAFPWFQSAGIKSILGHINVGSCQLLGASFNCFSFPFRSFHDHFKSYYRDDVHINSLSGSQLPQAKQVE